LAKEGTRSGDAEGGGDEPLCELARAAQRNEPEARERFARRARARVADAVDVEISGRLAREAGFDDVVQDVMLRIERNLARLKVVNEAAIHQWIITLVRHRIRDLHDYHHRAWKRDSSRRVSLSDLRREEQDGDPSEAMASPSPPPAEAASDRALFERAVAAIRQLPPEEAQAVRRVELEGETIAAVAKELDTGESTVRMRLGRGLTRIAQILGEEFCERIRRSNPE
jgi:RNA polymerase sigma factor (sigma-70 family)